MHFRARKTRFKCDFLSSIQQIKEMPNVVKIGAKTNTMQNINILLFVHLTVVNKLKALQLSTVGQSTIKHQHSKKLTWWIEAIWTKNSWKMLIVSRVCSQKMCKMSTFAWTHAWRRFLHWSTAVSIITCRKSDHTAIKHSFSILRTVNVQKAKCWYFAWC